MSTSSDLQGNACDNFRKNPIRYFAYTLHICINDFGKDIIDKMTSMRIDNFPDCIKTGLCLCYHSAYMG